MALRHRRIARLRRAARGRAGFVAAALAVYAAAGALATSPALRHAGSAFLAGGAPGYGEAAPGDHLQTAYRLWLVGHQLDNGRAPWRDPYTFRPEADAQLNPAGWPLGLPYWPLDAVFGHVLAYNLLLLLTYVGAGAFACAWLRELGLPRAAALLGGLAFALAPYRVEQSTGHLLGPIALLLPLALWALEARRPLLCALALGSIPLSGQVHLALGAIPFVCLYALARRRVRHVLLPTALAILAGVLVQRAVISHSIQAHGRSLHEVSQYSATGIDFVSRRLQQGNAERFIFVGWVTPLLALAGLVLAARTRRSLAAVLATGVAVPALLALGTHLPVYAWLWHALPPLRYPRVPERLMPIACLCIAALVALACARLPRILVLVAVAVVVVDLRVELYKPSTADGANAAYAAARSTSGRMLELPVFLPSVHYGSVYLYYDMQAQRERPGGYSTIAPPAADALARRLQRLDCGDWTDGTAALLQRLGVGAITLHRGLYTRNPYAHDRSWFSWRALLAHGWRPQVRGGGGVTLFVRGGGAASIPIAEPTRDEIAPCPGWYRHVLQLPRSSFWVYGRGAIRLLVHSARPLDAAFSAEGASARLRLDGAGEATLPLHGRRWHLVVVEAPAGALTLDSVRVGS
jgi:hypothetical protein